MPKGSKGKSATRTSMRKSKPMKRKAPVRKTVKKIGGGY